MSIRIFPDKTSFDFMGKRWYGFAVSLILSVLSLVLLATQGLNWGIDFTGGVLMEARYAQSPHLSDIRNALENKGLGEISLQSFGDGRDVMLRIQAAKGEDQGQVVQKAKQLLAGTGNPEFRRIDYVGPTVGSELLQDGILAVFLAFAAIMLYVWFRFEWQYGVGAILALLHDSIMIIGFFAVTRFEFGLTAIAAVLTIVGYSINDSVVIYDRIRENMRKFKTMPINALLNLSINETLSRTVLTASTVLLASLSLALFGGEVIKGFSWAMVFGIAIGTYSSIYISAPCLIYLKLRNTHAPVPAPANAA